MKDDLEKVQRRMEWHQYIGDCLMDPRVLIFGFILFMIGLFLATL